MDDYDEETSDNGSHGPAASGSTTGHEDEEQDAVSDDEDCNSSDNQQLLSSARLKAARWQEEYLKANSQKLHLPEHERGLSYWGRLFRQNADQARRRNEGRAQ
ncbi:hypothetical protein Cpir12675_003379 [Ceratocystis pirilliformis]|uniref:Uncharacterized protein n=1 Tax=Ceratocystis pirilliformis TaxID=259994 RepID=A0ABR3Z4E1_9PEZI